jgi:hypothetical protein
MRRCGEWVDFSPLDVRRNGSPVWRIVSTSYSSFAEKEAARITTVTARPLMSSFGDAPY